MTCEYKGYKIEGVAKGKADYYVYTEFCKGCGLCLAKCPINDGCCFTDGDTIKETQQNMYESVSLYLEGGCLDNPDYFLNFTMADE